MFGEQEQAHVTALMKAIKHAGGTPVKKPTFMFPVTDQASFLKLAYTLENVGVSAYNGAAPSICQQGDPGGGRLDRAGRGPSRGGDRPADPQADDADRCVRQAPEQEQVLAKAGPLIKYKRSPIRTPRSFRLPGLRRLADEDLC